MCLNDEFEQRHHPKAVCAVRICALKSVFLIQSGVCPCILKCTSDLFYVLFFVRRDAFPSIAFISYDRQKR